MFYEEKTEQGVWYCRTSPNGEWHKMTIVGLTRKIERMNEEMAKLDERIEELEAQKV